MEYKRDLQDIQKAEPFQDQLPRSRGDRWIDLLCRLIPIGTLVTPTAPADPVPGLALPGADVPEDTAMISAYYLSFYE